ncbi:hypothetical protein EV424DRAFT_929242 [Suillus variegatus]|nr:hypothetical protein EV424DRAFT_929242 [Suillus variegatus]
MLLSLWHPQSRRSHRPHFIFDSILFFTDVYYPSHRVSICVGAAYMSLQISQCEDLHPPPNYCAPGPQCGSVLAPSQAVYAYSTLAPSPSLHDFPRACHLKAQVSSYFKLLLFRKLVTVIMPTSAYNGQGERILLRPLERAESVTNLHHWRIAFQVGGRGRANDSGRHSAWADRKAVRRRPPCPLIMNIVNRLYGQVDAGSRWTSWCILV